MSRRQLAQCAIIIFLISGFVSFVLLLIYLFFTVTRTLFPYASTKYAIKTQIKNSILVNSLGVFFLSRRHVRDINDKQYQIRTTTAAAAAVVVIAPVVAL